MVKEDPQVAKQDPQRVGTLKLSLIDKQLIALHLIGWRGGEEGGWIQGAQDFSGRDWPEILILGFFKEKSLIQLWPGEKTWVRSQNLLQAWVPLSKIVGDPENRKAQLWAVFHLSTPLRRNCSHIAAWRSRQDSNLRGETPLDFEIQWGLPAQVRILPAAPCSDVWAIAPQRRAEMKNCSQLGFPIFWITNNFGQGDPSLEQILWSYPCFLTRP